MLLLTERIPAALFYKCIDHTGLGFWYEPQTKRTFFYCVCRNITIDPIKPSFTFRTDIHAPSPQWEFVGQVDFWWRNASVSPCGRYFWSMEFVQRWTGNGPAQLEFHQINPKTLQFTKFDVTPTSKEISFV